MFKFFKKVGETSLETLQRARIDRGISDEVPMTYAGTLDPMASGELLILEGGECKEKDKYSGSDKEYDVEIVFGVSTDSDDILGIIEDSEEVTSINKTKVESFLKSLLGKQKQKYHPFSHKKIKGVPLFRLAKKGELRDEDLPENEVEIYAIDVLEWSSISVKELKNYIFESVSRLKGDFRQDKILNCWENFFDNNASDSFIRMKFRTKVSSGTYVRNIVRKLKTELGLPVLVFHINRKEIYI